MGLFIYLITQSKIGWGRILSVFRFLAVFLTIVIREIILLTINITTNNIKVATANPITRIIQVKIAFNITKLHILSHDNWMHVAYSEIKIES